MNNKATCYIITEQIALKKQKMANKDVIEREKARIAHLEATFSQQLERLKEAPYRDAIVKHYTNIRSQHTENHTLSIAVIGLGPSGLAASLEAYKHGFKVVAVEPRSDYRREQAFRFPTEDFEAWFNDFLGIENIETLEEDHPLKVILSLGVFAKRKTRIDESLLFGSPDRPEKEHYELATKHLEQFFFAILMTLSDLDSTHLTVRRGYEFDDYSDNQGVLIKHTTTKETISLQPINLVLGCDGIHSKTREAARIGITPLTGKKTYIAATFYQDTQRNEKKGFVEQFTSIKDGSFLEVQEDSLFPVRAKILYAPTSPRQQEAAAAGAFHALPAVRCFFTAIGTYIGVEKIEDRTPIEQCRAVMRTIFRVEIDPPSAVVDPHTQEYKERFIKQQQEHYPKDYHVFEVQLFKANEKLKRLANGITYIPIGDAHANAHFQTGSGAFYGIQSAQKVIYLISNKAEEEKVIATLQSIEEELLHRVNHRFLDVHMPAPLAALPPPSPRPSPRPAEINDAAREVYATIEKMDQYGKKLTQKGAVKGVKITTLTTDLKTCLDEFLSAENQSQRWPTFKEKFTALLDDQEGIMQAHRATWKPLVINLLIALTGIGACVLLGYAGYKAFLYHTKSHASVVPLPFFKTRSIKYLEQIKTASDKILPEEQPSIEQPSMTISSSR